MDYTKKSLKKLLIDTKIAQDMKEKAFRNTRNKIMSEFPQPGSFASSRNFTPSILSGTTLKQNFVYQSPRNKNCEVKMKAMATCKSRFLIFSFEWKEKRNFIPKNTHNQ